MSPTRRLLRLLSFAALAAALLLLWRHQRPAPTPAPPPRLAPSQQTSPPLSAPAAPQARGAEVTLDVIDAAGDPIEGVTIALNGAEGTTGAGGRLTLRGVQEGVAVTTVSPPWLIRAGSTDRSVQGPRQRRLLVLERACPGALRLVEEDGGPIEGARVFRWHTAQISAAGSAVPLISDSTGEAFLPQRPCGAVSVSVRLPGGEVLPDLSVFVEDSGPATLLIPRPRAGTLLVVGEDGRLLPATVRPLLSAAVEPDGVGRFDITARRALLPVTVLAEGYPEQLVRVPLTGGVFEHFIDTPRAVDVAVRCDEGDCPERLTCAQAPCERLDARSHRCACPDEVASLSIQTGEHAFTEVGTIYPEDTSAELDLRGSASLRGRWIGDLPCEVRVRYERTSSHRGVRSCDEEGRFEFFGLRPGWVTVSIQGRGEQAAHSLELLAGDTLDMGELWPDTASASGYIEADFPLQGARLESFPHATAALEPGGTFALEGLPGQARSVTLRLDSPIYGSFRETFPLAAGEEIVWALSWRPEESALGDTADPVLDSGDPGGDSGLIEGDTGWSEIGDSGWDSGL